MLCSCVGREDKLAPELQVSLPETCERILQEVPLPDIAATDDARTAFIKDDAALITANGTIVAGRTCIADVRKAYRVED
jgi:hypothetical protein